MGEPVELCDIVGGTANDDSENAYEIPQASTDEGRYENLRINTGDGLAAGSNIVSDTDTNHKVEDSNGSESRSTCVKHISAVRQLQMLCAVLFTIVIICSVTIGVLINKLVSRRNIFIGIPLDLSIPTEMTSIEALVENEKLMKTPTKLKIMLSYICSA